MRTSALLLLVSLVAYGDADPPGRFDRFCDRADTGRSTRGLACGSIVFEAFTAGGVGMPAACSTTAPTGTKGEVLTFTRASSATCVKTPTGGLVTSGIANGDLVLLSNDQARVEYDFAGVRGVLVEPTAATNLLLRYIEYANAAWADVATPILTGAQTDPFGATNAVQINDDNAAAFEGRSQAVTVSAGAAYTMHCLVKGNSLLKARVSLDGTTADISGLSTTTWSIVSVTDASASGVSISAQVLNGNAVGDTGTVIWGGCQVEAGSTRSSIIPTAGATATRATEGVPNFPVTVANGSAASSAVSIATSFTPTTGTTLVLPHASGNPAILGRFNAGNFGCYQMTAGADLAAGTWVTGTNRWACSTQRTATLNGTTNSGSVAALTSTITTVGIGSTGGFGTAVPGVYTNICVDSTATRCAQ